MGLRLIMNVRLCLFFISKQDKAVVLFDEIDTFEGAILNHAVHSAINLLLI